MTHSDCSRSGLRTGSSPTTRPTPLLPGWPRQAPGFAGLVTCPHVGAALGCGLSILFFKLLTCFLKNTAGQWQCSGWCAQASSCRCHFLYSGLLFYSHSSLRWGPRHLWNGDSAGHHHPHLEVERPGCGSSARAVRCQVDPASPSRGRRRRPRVRDLLEVAGPLFVHGQCDSRGKSCGRIPLN